MNRIEKLENGTYVLTCENGEEFICTRWYEKKKDYWHVCPPKKGVEICGRSYIRESFFDKSNVYEFETKTEHREGLGNGGWKSRLTEDEKAEYEALEARMEELKKLALSRPAKELSEEEKLEREIAKKQKALEELRAKKNNQ